MLQGWIKLYRKLLNDPIAHKPNYLALWITLLLLANHQDHEFVQKDKKRQIKRGQILTGRDALSRQTGIKSSTIERILKYFENEQQIEQQTTNKYRVITILNWESYQNIEKQTAKKVGSKTDSKKTANGQQMDTYKNDKNNKNDKKIHNTGKNSKFTPPTIEQIRERCKEKGYTIKPETFYYYYEANGWMVGKNKMKSWKAALSQWAYKDNAFEKKPNWWKPGKYD